MLSGRYPALAGLDEDVFGGVSGDGGANPVFALGLAALLDGFAAVIAARAAASPAPPPRGTRPEPPPPGATHRAAT
ncbi:hypothetical protein ADL22_22470 [Streptomyces sp. NRRL F-4489]|uniref:hypothetical protein n=1 Tax=Streptomyces sp. NRRL F-4489 TaxID=1609095 RepID=UPI000748ACD2|nr:hypothetical protein [Streptomyces sp. NRRL F-4489]KUL37158.1 hypothetical protein ADL22_22470 [Streptomyces sp. NRRL F-4489]